MNSLTRLLVSHISSMAENGRSLLNFPKQKFGQIVRSIACLFVGHQPPWISLETRRVYKITNIVCQRCGGRMKFKA